MNLIVFENTAKQNKCVVSKTDKQINIGQSHMIVTCVTAIIISIPFNTL